MLTIHLHPKDICSFLYRLRSLIRLRSGAATESARLQWHRNGQEELPKSKVRGGGQEELPHTPMPEGRGGSWEEQPHIQGEVAARAQEGLEELSHVEGQEGRR